MNEERRSRQYSDLGAPGAPPRIAWLLTSAFYYWQPMLSHLVQHFPEMTAFTAKWQGYAPGFENAFPVELVGERRIVTLKESEVGYGSTFTYLPLGIVQRLLRFKPQVIFSNSFGVWTVLALMLKPLGWWRVIIAYEGSSPSVDYQNDPTRLTLRRLMVRMADACITNSQAGKQYLNETLHAPAHQVFAHPYEVPSIKALSGLTATSVLNTDHLQRPTFLFVGSLKPRKGLHLLLKACALLQKQGCDQYTLLVVGDGTQRQELQTFCQTHNLMDRILWAGHVEYGQLGTYFCQADVFVLPTLEDTWGVVVLEAMLLGKPILCSLNAGAAELVGDGENGYCFNPNHPEQLAEMMSRFIHYPDLIVAMGHKSQERIRPYSPESAAQFLADVTAFVLDN